MSEKLPKPFVSDADREKSERRYVSDITKATEMAHAENADRTNAEYHKRAIEIMNEASENRQQQDVDFFLEEAKEKAVNMVRDSGQDGAPHEAWRQEKEVHAATLADETYAESYSLTNDFPFTSKDEDEYALDHGVKRLTKDVARLERRADKAGDSAAKQYDKSQKKAA